MYLKILSKVNSINSKERSISNLCITDFILCKFSILITPFFLILKFNPNQITIINFFVGMFSIYLINFEYEYFQYGILIFFLFILLDHIDGSVARYGTKTFFGKFLDALFDAIVFGLFFVSLTLYSFNFTGNIDLLIFGIFSSALLLIDVLTLDKFAVLVRWSNEQNNKKFKPYIRKTKFFRFFASLRDLIFIGAFSLIFVAENIEYFQISLIIIFSSMTISTISNVLMHIYYAKQYLRFKKK
ncbi:CDP-alcohol phosphatidyltransferase family protein [Candidatus Pelagibacter sp.]|nr:CDP-alcohol phosphatidyltransferase family protein [Candidatus Pelagibacter sp.]